MSRKANHFVIGLFVLASISLLVGGLVVFGSGALFRESQRYVTYFDGSVKGLREGASVLFRGVKIGEIKDVHLQIDHQSESVRIPVVFEIYPDSILEVGQRPSGEGRVIRRMIEQGLRARLEMESIVTGLLAVNLNFHPETKPEYVGGMNQYMEIPSIPSTLDLLSDAFGDVPIGEVVKDFQKMAQGLSRFIESDAFQNLPHEIVQGTEDFRTFLASARKLLARLDEDLVPLSKDLRHVGSEAKETLVEIRKTVSNANDILAEDSPTRYELRELIEEVKEAAIRVRELSEYLERNPEALLRGK
ncbi:MAG: MCE family protein [Bdellovibrionales bacterium]|nr:MCE family protein [Bdellovibrionales bacterium]